ncbi:MAG: GH39 family glycosyl hydrolase, partial [Anaerolineae bacterium]
MPTVTPTPTRTPEREATKPSTIATPTFVPSPDPADSQATATLDSPTPAPTPTATPEALRSLTVDVNAAKEQGAFDKARFLNGSIGGYAPLSNYNWLPGAYDELTTIGMEMVRLDHIVDDAFYQVVWRSSSGLEFDFSRLNRVVVPLVEAGMTPLMCLSYKPDALAPEGASSLPPADMDEWAEVVAGFVAHFQRMGYTGLHWEVWNEPDQAFFFQGGPEAYIELYVTTARAVKEVDPTARVGGAADSSVTSPHGKLQPLLDYISQHPDVPLDFVSYHDYSDPDGDGLPPFDLGWNVETIEGMISEAGLAPLDILVTEWNLTPSLTTGAGAPTDTN